MTRIYFSGSIRGGNEKHDDYAAMIKHIEKEGNEVLSPFNEDELDSILTVAEIYKRDTAWISRCSGLIADVTIPSLGVGFEIAYALNQHKPVIVVYERDANVSAMIIGNNHVKCFPYDDPIDGVAKALNRLKQMRR